MKTNESIIIPNVELVNPPTKSEMDLAFSSLNIITALHWFALQQQDQQHRNQVTRGVTEELEE